MPRLVSLFLFNIISEVLASSKDNKRKQNMFRSERKKIKSLFLHRPLMVYENNSENNKNAHNSEGITKVSRKG